MASDWRHGVAVGLGVLGVGSLGLWAYSRASKNAALAAEREEERQRVAAEAKAQQEAQQRAAQQLATKGHRPDDLQQWISRAGQLAEGVERMVDSREWENAVKLGSTALEEVASLFD